MADPDDIRSGLNDAAASIDVGNPDDARTDVHGIVHRRRMRTRVAAGLGVVALVVGGAVAFAALGQSDDPDMLVSADPTVPTDEVADTAPTDSAASDSDVDRSGGRAATGARCRRGRADRDGVRLPVARRVRRRVGRVPTAVAPRRASAGDRRAVPAGGDRSVRRGSPGDHRRGDHDAVRSGSARRGVRDHQRQPRGVGRDLRRTEHRPPDRRRPVHDRRRRAGKRSR